jgi:hypothetical protein
VSVRHYSQSDRIPAWKRNDALCHYATSPRLFDHLVGRGEQLARNFQPERVRSLEVDDQFEFSALYDRQIRGLLTLEYATRINTTLAVYDEPTTRKTD